MSKARPEDEVHSSQHVLLRVTVVRNRGSAFTPGKLALAGRVAKTASAQLAGGLRVSQRRQYQGTWEHPVGRYRERLHCDIEGLHQKFASAHRARTTYYSTADPGARSGHVLQGLLQPQSYYFRKQAVLRDLYTCIRESKVQEGMTEYVHESS